MSARLVARTEEEPGCVFVALSFLLVLLSCSTQAADTSLTVTVGGETRNFTREALLARSDAATIEVPFDISYRVPMTYRAVPVAALLAGMKVPPERDRGRSPRRLHRAAAARSRAQHR